MRLSEFSKGWKPTALAVAVLLVGAWPSFSNATPLDALEGSTQSIGGLTFHFTKVEETGGIVLQNVDLTLVSDALGVGFDVTPLVAGALGATNGALKDLKLEFTITTTVGVDQAGNHLTATADGFGSSSSVSELIDEVPAVDLGVFVAWFGSQPDAVESLGGTYYSLTVTKNLVVSAGANGSTDIQRLEQRFRVVPEPTTAFLLLLGFSGLAYQGRQRG
jgi:phage gp37-like protein